VDLRSRIGPHRLRDVPGVAIRAIRRWTFSTAIELVYCRDRDAVANGTRQVQTPDTEPFQLDRLEDFARYAGSDRWMTRQWLMGEAIRRLDEGHHSYSYVENGVLAHFAWLHPGATRIPLSETGVVVQLPERSAVCFGDYTEPQARGRGFQKASVAVRTRHAFDLGFERVFSVVAEANIPSRRAYEANGFRVTERYVARRILGQTRRYQSRVT